MKKNIVERIDRIRDLLTKPLQAFIISSSDAHMSEYVASHWEGRKWFSGFTGSAGTLLVTAKSAAVWTDSRYFLQAADQLEGTGISLQKEMLPETPSIPEYLGNELNRGEEVGIDGTTFSVTQVREMERMLAPYQLSLSCHDDLIDQAWIGRPEIPTNKVKLYPIEYSGRSTADKIADIRKAIGKDTSILVSALDEIAWTLNLRGDDIECNPLFIGYLVIHPDSVHFFINPKKITPEVGTYLKGQHIECHDYTDIRPYLQQIGKGNMLVSPDKTAYSVYRSVSPQCNILEQDSPISLMKAIRNETEIEGIHEAMLQDGVALVKFLMWLEQNVPGGKVSELSASRYLQSLRASHPLYIGESFETISGYKEHAAIVHYTVNEETDIPLRPEGLLLVDSGAQYLNGTTDITRTIVLGPLNDEEKTDYTLVLKGNIDLAMAQFPFGTRGAQLDILARLPLWEQGMNFLHGTGHGVGHCLNVHEGPQSIRMNENPVIFHPGMLTSDEPGVYKTGKHGIRIENLLLCKPYKEGMFGTYLEFETVTLCPISKAGIRKELLTPKEIEWFNAYHEKVYRLLAPLLSDNEQSWLRTATEAI